MTLAHLTHTELPLLLAAIAAGAGAGVVFGLRLAVRALARRRAARD